MTHVLIDGRTPARINLALSSGAVTTSLLPSLLPVGGPIDRVPRVDVTRRALRAPRGDEDRNDDQRGEEGFFRGHRRGVAHANLR